MHAVMYESLFASGFDNNNTKQPLRNQVKKCSIQKYFIMLNIIKNII